MAIFKVSTNMADAHAPSGFDPLPPGEYLCEIHAAELKPTSTPGRNMIKLTLRVADGEFTNRRIFDNRNFPLPDEGPDSFIAQKLRELFDAVPGSYDYEAQAGDTDALVGAQVTVSTKNEARKNKDKTPMVPEILDTRVTAMYNPEAVPETAAPAETPAEPAPAPAPAKAAAAPAKAPAKPAAAPAKPAAKPAAALAAAAAPVQRSPFRRSTAG